jgi:hypothetical protein
MSWIFKQWCVSGSVWDIRSIALQTSGSGIQDGKIPDPGTAIRGRHTGSHFRKLSKKLLGEKYSISLQNKPYNDSRTGIRSLLTTGSEIRDLVWKNLEEQINNGSYEYAPEHRYKVNCTQLPVLRIRIRDPVPVWPLDPGSGIGKMSGSGSGMNLNSLMRIRDPG